MTVFTIVTPAGERYEMSGDPKTVAAAALFLGDGMMRVEDPAGRVIVPFTNDKLRTFRDAFGCDLNGVLREDRYAVAAALRTIQSPRARFLASAIQLACPTGGLRG